jgi:hypothetical protein
LCLKHFLEVIMKTTLAKKILTIFLFFSLLFSFTPTIIFSQDAGNPAGDHNEGQSNSTPTSVVGNNIQSDTSCSYGWNIISNGIFGGKGDLVKTLGSCIGGLISTLVQPIASWLFWGIGILLEYVLYFIGYIVDKIISITVLNYKYYFYDTFLSYGDTNTPNPGNYIYLMWAFIRDLLNTAVFFIMMYHAIRSMIEGFTEIKNKFISLLVFALLVNFSLLFVKVIIDASNIVTLTIYQSAVPQYQNNDSFGNGNIISQTTNEQGSPTNFTSYVIKSLNPAERWKNNVGAKVIKMTDEEASMYDTAAFQIGYALSLAYLCYIFLLIGSTFLVRAGTFIAAMILSPLIVAQFFANSAGIKKVSDQVKATLIDYSLRGPLYLFIVLFSASLARSMFSSKIAFDYNIIHTGALALKEMFTTSVTYAQSTQALTGGLVVTEGTMFIRFLVFIGIFHSLKLLVDNVISSLSHDNAFAGKWASKMAGWSGTKLLRGGTRVGSYAGKLTGGNLGRYMTEGAGGKFMQKWVGSENRLMKYSGLRMLGEGIAMGGKKMADGTWDLANSKTYNSGAYKKFSNALGIDLDLGKASKTTAKDFSKNVYGALKERRAKSTARRAELISSLGADSREYEAGDITGNEINSELSKESSKIKGEYNTHTAQIKSSLRTLTEEIKVLENSANKKVKDSLDSEAILNSSSLSSSNKAFASNLSDADIKVIQEAIVKGTPVKVAGKAIDASDTKAVADYAETVKKLKELKSQAEIENTQAKQKRQELETLFKQIKESREKRDEDISKISRTKLSENIAKSKNDATKARQESEKKRIIERDANEGVFFQEAAIGLLASPFDRKGNPMRSIAKAKEAARKNVKEAATIEVTRIKAHKAREESMQKWYVAQTDLMMSNVNSVFNGLENANKALHDQIQNNLKSETDRVNNLKRDLTNMLGKPGGHKDYKKLSEDVTNAVEALQIKQMQELSKYLGNIAKTDPALSKSIDEAIRKNAEGWNKHVSGYSYAFPEEKPTTAAPEKH